MFGGSPASKLPSRLATATKRQPEPEPEPAPEREEEDYEYEFEQSVLSNTSIASFHEFPPHALEALTRENDEDQGETRDDEGQADNSVETAAVLAQPAPRASTSRALPTPPSGPPSGRNSLSNSLSKSPLISKEVIQRQLEEQWAGSRSASPSTPSTVPSAARVEQKPSRIPGPRPTLEERLKRAVSPLAATSPRPESPRIESPKLFTVPIVVPASRRFSCTYASPVPYSIPRIRCFYTRKEVHFANKAHSHDAEVDHSRQLPYLRHLILASPGLEK